MQLVTNSVVANPVVEKPVFVANPILELKNVNYKIDGMDRLVLDNINLKLYPGELVVLLGGNGSGKSSLIKVMNKTTPFSSGSIEFNQMPLETLNNKELASKVVTLAQDPVQSLFYDLTVLENCLLWEMRHHTDAGSVSLKQERTFFEEYLKEYHPRLSERLNSQVSVLSGGEKQALLLALCVRKPPRLLLLDEHTSALDPIQANKIMELTLMLVRKHGITTLMTSHNLDHALEFGDRMIALREGKIVFQADNETKSKLTRECLLQGGWY